MGEGYFSQKFREVSHGHERQDKICLNCNAVVYGRYCHLCGQENIEVKERFRDVSKHLVYDITHFDSKFFDTIRYLLFRPGYLTYEYLRGRRQRYLNPIKMYVFVSALFFLMMATLNKKENSLITIKESKAPTAEDSIRQARIMDSVARELKKQGIDANRALRDTAPPKKVKKTLAGYRRAQDSLPAEQRDSRLIRFVNERMIKASERHGGEVSMWTSIGKELGYQMPKIMFLLLPLNALILMWVYRRKQMFYVQHLFFLVHLVCASFILLLVSELLNSGKHLPWIGGLLDFLGGIVVFYLLFYIYKALRNFYQQSRAKTLVKYLLLFFLIVFISTLLILAIGFVLFLMTA